MQLAALLALGSLTVARFQLFAPVDERAHYAFVQEVAEEGRLPILGNDVISAEAQAINDGTWPRPSQNDPRTLGFAGQSYEAFQPPLYYVVAAPVFALAGDHRDKVLVLRVFDLALLGVAVAFLCLLARAVFKERWLLPFAFALPVLLWPGSMARAVTVSNAALELPVVLAFLLAVWTALERRSPRALVAAGALLGLCLLTKLTLVFLAPLLLAAAARLLRNGNPHAGRSAAVAVAVALALPAVMLAPWVASNLARYDAPTANALARDQQTPVLYPGGERPSAADLPAGVARLADGVLPQEWWPEYDKLGFSLALRFLPLVLLLVLVLPLARRAWPDRRRSLVLGLPVALAVATQALTLVVADWDIFQPRYLYSTLPAFALLAAWAMSRNGSSERPALLLATGATAVILLAWVFMIGGYYFTDVGSSLGIQPAGG